jgi:serpin B
MDQPSDRFSRRDTLLAGVALALLAACQAQSANPPAPAPSPPAPDNPQVPPPSPAAQQLGAATTAFGLAMLTQLMADAPKTTLVTSPLSLAATVLMLGQGAKGPAANSLTAGLKLPPQGLSLSAAAEGFANLAARLVSSSAATVAIADGLWADTHAGLKPDFQKTLHDLFAADARIADLTSAAALADINGFVDQTTHGKITQILSQMPAGAMIVLVNALYFKGGWKTPFDASQTQTAPFAHADGTRAPAPLMHRSGEFSYRETDHVQALALPYADPRFELRLVLEKPGAPAGAWTDGFADYDSERAGEVFLPRLDLAWGADITGLVAALGMEPALAPTADYSAAMTAPFGSLDVVQKCVLKVDEEGAEAAASTALVMEGAAAPLRNPPPPFVFRADRPFYLMLVETGTGAPLILSYVAAPTS